MTNEKPVRRVLNRLRKMNYWQRMMIRDWLNAWYSDYKEQEEIEAQEYADYMRDDCICREDHIDSGCPECF